MEKKLKFIEVNYHFHREFTTPDAVITKHLPSNLFAEELSKTASVTLIKHLAYDGVYHRNEIHYRFFRRRNSFWQIPFSTHRFLRNEKPDIVLVQGFIYPLQVIALRFAVGSNCKIILQHRAEVPFRRKRIFQQWADKFVNAYFFTAMEQADEWIRAGVIKDRNKCFEIPAATTRFSKKNKLFCREKLGMGDDIIFLWAGRLNANKDPLTVLAAFEKYIRSDQGAKLYMIYQEDDMLEMTREKINASTELRNNVMLIGKVAHEEMELWYSAADYIISASHREGGSYVVMEAMACGCVPIVSTIPASIKMIEKGRVGFYFEAGSSDDLYRVLLSLKHEDHETRSAFAAFFFKSEMSAEAIARKMLTVFGNLLLK
ncbi:MAG: glycosyltransferase family 4 protein [Chitinophagales bacterium]|nr:glycosyltransferase family 4 protein [Chitinophagales bacterium]